MRIGNALLFIDGSFKKGAMDFDERILSFTDKTTDMDIDAQGCYVIPGLVDIHTHGAIGEDVSDGIASGLTALSTYYATGGVTSWCPTTMTLKEPVLAVAMEMIRDFNRPEGGARIAGIHLEGPFLSYSKRGAQAADNLHAPDIEMFNRLNAISGGKIKLITIAPEEPGAIEFIKEVSKTCTISLGHTCSDYNTAMAAYEAGASHTTHLYNGMGCLHHREPGVIAAASDAGASVELICDGFHIHPSVIRLTHRLFGERLVMISDSLRCAGMPDGDYMLGGQPITVTDGKAFLSGTETIAGSSIHLMDALKRSVSFGVPLEAAVIACTLAPARAIDCDTEIGSLAVGKYADFCILDENLNLKSVYINGKLGGAL